METFWRAAAGGVSVSVKVQPKARRAGIQGRAPDVDGERLRVAVAEPAEDGRANEALCPAMAAALDVPRAAVVLVAGVASRLKRLQINGDPLDLAQRLEGM